MPEHAFSVATLLHWFADEGDWAAPGSGRVLGQEGGRWHRRIQAKWGATIEAELSLCQHFSMAGQRFRITGRVDGLQADPPAIIEIKRRRSARVRLSDWQQLRLYAGLWSLGQSQPPAEIQLHLLLASPESAGEVQHTQSIDGKEAIDYLHHYCERLSRRLAQRQRSLALAREQLEVLAFPMPSFRSGQHDGARQVYQHIRDTSALLLEAPTGSGKTLTCLFAALKALGKNHCDQIFMASARHSGHLAPLAALQLLLDENSALRVLQLSGRRQHCLRRCGTPRECPRQTACLKRLERATEEALTLRWLDQKTLGRLADDHAVCPQNLQVRLWPWVQVIIGDFNYMLAPGVRTEFPFRLNRCTLLIDEAHQFPVRARSIFSAELAPQSLRRVMQQLPAGDLPLRRALQQTLRQLSAGTLQSEALKAALETLVQTGLDWLAPEAGETLPLLESSEETNSDLRQCIEQSMHWLAMQERAGEDFALLSPTAEEPVWRLQNVAPGRLIQESLGKPAGQIFLSAGLRPQPFYQRLLGLEKAGFCVLHSPFAPERVCHLSLTCLSQRSRDRDRNLAATIDVIHSVWQARAGNYWVFSSSFSYCATLYSAWVRRYPDTPALLQERDDSPEARSDFIGRFKHDTAAPGTIGFVVLGSVLAESIDLPGDSLLGAIVLGTGLTPPDRISALQAEWFGRHYPISGDLAARILPGFERVLQAVGRVIRSEQDRGVTLLVDDRFSRPPYPALFPPHWQPQQVESLAALAQKLAAFWDAAQNRETP